MKNNEDAVQKYNIWNAFSTGDPKDTTYEDEIFK
jgi:hypothetical protein